MFYNEISNNSDDSQLKSNEDHKTKKSERSNILKDFKLEGLQYGFQKPKNYTQDSFKLQSYENYRTNDEKKKAKGILNEQKEKFNNNAFEFSPSLMKDRMKDFPVLKSNELHENKTKSARIRKQITDFHPVPLSEQKSIVTEHLEDDESIENYSPKNRIDNHTVSNNLYISEADREIRIMDDKRFYQTSEEFVKSDRKLPKFNLDVCNLIPKNRQNIEIQQTNKPIEIHNPLDITSLDKHDSLHNLQQYAMKIMDSEKLQLNDDDMRIFLTSPIPHNVTFQCNIVRKKSMFSTFYYVYTNHANGRFLMAAKKKSGTSSYFTISLNHDSFKDNDKCYLGRLSMNFLGSEYKLYDHGKPVKEAKTKEEIRNNLAYIQYAMNILGLGGPRKFEVYLPEVNPETFYISKFRQTIDDSAIYKLIKGGIMRNIKKFVNKKPVWSEKHQAYILDFKGRVTIPSIKNFHLVEDKEDNKNVVLLFGRRSNSTFAMDFTFPLTPLQAFGICLSSLTYKITSE